MNLEWPRCRIEQPSVCAARLIRRVQRALKVRFKFGPILTILATALGICPLAHAQHGSGASAPVAARPASSAAVSSHPVSMQGSTSSRANVRAVAASGAGRSSQRQNASSPIIRHKPPHTPGLPPTATPRGTGFYLFYGGGGYFVPAEGDESADQSPDDQANVAQSGGDQSIDPSDQNQSPERSAMAASHVPASQRAGEESDAPQNVAERQDEAPLPDEGEFTLVMNDGTWIEAVAFTHANDRIVYITAAGSRYTIAASDLDADATVRVNQERGTPLQSPL